MQFILHRVSYSFSLQLQTSSCSSLIVIPPSLHLLPSDVSFGQWFESHAVLQAPHITFSTSWITQTGASYDRRSPVPNWPQPFQPHDQPDLLSREIIPTKKSMVVRIYVVKKARMGKCGDMTDTPTSSNKTKCYLPRVTAVWREPHEIEVTLASSKENGIAWSRRRGSDWMLTCSLFPGRKGEINKRLRSAMIWYI